MMADQNLIAMHHVPLLVKQLCNQAEQTCHCSTKVDLWYILITFPHEHGSLPLSVYAFNNHQKMNSLNISEM